MAVAYMTIFVTTGPVSVSWSRNLASALSNAVPLAIYAYLAISLLRTHVVGRAGWQQLLLNAVAMPAFGFTWYVTVIVLLGWSQGSLNEGFSVSPFRGPAFAWQFFQGMTAYAAVAGAAYALEYRSRIEPDPQAANDANARRLFSARATNFAPSRSPRSFSSPAPAIIPKSRPREARICPANPCPNSRPCCPAMSSFACIARASSTWKL